MATTARGNVFINEDECKGCGLCVESCPPHCLALAPELSGYGVHPARYSAWNARAAVSAFTAAPNPERLPFTG